MNLLAKLFGQAAKEPVTWVESDKLSTMLKAKSLPPLVIDVRGPEEFIGPLGHIDEAKNIPLDQIPARTADLLSQPRVLVFVCHTDRRSSAAAEHLRRAGGKDVVVLRGGMVAWRSRSVL